MNDLPLNAIRAFAAVYETGGVRPAARALGITHSAVSRHLRELEAWLGVPLLQRREGRRALAFTSQGEALGRAGLASLRGLSDAVAALREVRRGNTVTISTTPSVAARWLLPRLSGLAARHPAIEISVVADQRLAAPDQQGADLALRMGRGPWPELAPDFAARPLMDDRLFPVASPATWAKAGRPQGHEALARVRLLHDRDPQASWAVWRSAFGPADLDLRPGPRFASSDLVLRAAAQGMGVALARGRLAADDLAAGSLIRPLGAQEIRLPQAYWIVQPAGAPQRAAVAAVIAWLMDQAALDGPTTVPSGR